MSALVTVHIHLDKAGVAWIDDSNIKVIEVVLDKLAHGWNLEEIHAQHPHLSLAQIHAALSYYYDHQLDIDRVIEQELREVEHRTPTVAQSALRKRLRAIGQLPAQEDGAARLPDSELLDRSTALGRVLFSQDKDLLREAVRRQ